MKTFAIPYRELVAASVASALLANLAPARTARADEPAPAPRERDDAYLLRLGEHFYSDAQYYRAIGVFDELAFVTRDEGLLRHARLRIAMAYHHGLQIDAAVAAYDRVLADGGLDADTAGFVRVLRVVVRAEGDARDLSPLPLGDLTAELAPLTTIEGAAFAPLASYHLARLELADGHRERARAAVDRGEAACRARPVEDCAALARFAEPLAWSGPRRLSPGLGLTLSAAVPGLGAVYGGHTVDALTYFGLTVGTGLLAWDVRDGGRSLGDQRASFYVLVTTAATFYVANLVQGWFGVERRNATEVRDHRVRVLDATEWPLPLEDQVPAPSAPFEPPALTARDAAVSR